MKNQWNLNYKRPRVKELNTPCRNLLQVHTIVRPYFGSVEKTECHMLYNVTTMATTWHTVATRDVRLLKKQLDIVNVLPVDCMFTTLIFGRMVY